MVFPLPGGPEMRVTVFLGMPPLSILSSPSIPVFIRSNSLLVFGIGIFSDCISAMEMFNVVAGIIILSFICLYVYLSHGIIGLSCWPSSVKEKHIYRNIYIFIIINIILYRE